SDLGAIPQLAGRYIIDEFVERGIAHKRIEGTGCLIVSLRGHITKCRRSVLLVVALKSRGTWNDGPGGARNICDGFVSLKRGIEFAKLAFPQALPEQVPRTPQKRIRLQRFVLQEESGLDGSVIVVRKVVLCLLRAG